MNFIQRKSGWLIAVTAATALWTACAPEFEDDICVSNDDCFANEVCLANSCVVRTQGNDAGNNVEDADFTDVDNDVDEKTDVETPVLNACGGLTELDNEPGDPCGPCDLDEYICDGQDNTVCDGETACPDIGLITTKPTDITATGATFHGKVQSLTANDLPSEHGFCWSTDALPTKDNGECHDIGPLAADDQDFEYIVDDLNQGTHYHVRAFHTDSTGTAYVNVIDFTTLAPIPTNFEASEGTETAFVKLEWDDMPGVTEYHVFRDDVLLSVVDQDTTTFNDEDAAPGELSAPKNPTASNDSVTKVTLSAEAADSTHGASLPYAVRAKYPDALSAHSPEADGFRGVGPITYQWQRAQTNVDAEFSALVGVTTLNAEDTTAPPSGDKRFYRVVASAPGASSQASIAVEGSRIPSASPFVDTITISDITKSSAKATATIGTLGVPPATNHGFCIGTSPAPATQCDDLGAPPASGTFESVLASLDSGTTYYVRAYLTEDGTRHFSADATFMTLLEAPTNVSASNDKTAHVTISWNAVTGATSYEVHRDGNPIATDVQSPFQDVDADEPAPATAPTLTATSSSPLHVKLDWSGATTAPGTTHEYTVIAVNDDGEKSAASDPVSGNRAALTITKYQIQRDGGPWDDVGLVTTYNDTNGPAPLITAGTITIEIDKPVAEQNTFTVSGQKIDDGAEATYNVRAVTDAINGATSDDAKGQRTAGALNMQWQSKASGATTFTKISGQTSATYVDTDPLNQEIQVLFTSDGADDVTSNIVVSTAP